MGSITKVFTGIVLASLVREGVVGLGDRVSTHLPRDLVVPSDPTLLKLATHGAGLPNTTKGMAWRELAFMLGLRKSDPHVELTPDRFRADLARTGVRHRRFRYSSLAFGLLGEALANLTGQPYAELVRERVCLPLGMQHTTIAAPAGAVVASGSSRRGRPRPPFRDERLMAAGGLLSSPADMVLFLRANLQPRETGIAEAIELAQLAHTEPRRRLSVGLGWMILTGGGKRVHWHNGGTWGFRSSIAVLRERGSGVVVLSARARSVDRLCFRLLDAVSKRDGL
ncbi:MAG: beta-lactamase family protein [Actinobacteria bacterium]|nr:beta-lactamase family protein [Actinomycetota bacterium]